jgi:two-component system sensor histidine kinase UhpB
MPGKSRTKQELLNEVSSLHRKIEELERIEISRFKDAEELRKSEEKYRNLVELTLDLIFMVDEKGRYTYVNPRFEKVTGYSVGDLIGRPFIHLVAPEVIQSTIDRFKRGMRGEDTPPYEAELIHKNGDRIPVEFLVTTQYDDQGRPTGRLGIGRDITERRKADRALRQLAADLAKAQLLAHIGNWRYDIDTKLSVWSEEMFRIFGLEPMPSTPSRIHHKRYIHPDDWPKYEESVRSILAGKQFEVELRILRPDGSVCNAFTRGEPEYDQSGNIKGLFGTTQDVTERVLAEKTLKAQSEQLRILSAKLSEAQEVERKRIARELHDQVGQNLTVVGINLNILRSAISKDSLTAHHNCLLDDSMMLVEQTSEFTRSLMADLRPPDMDDYGLIAAIHWYSERFSMRTGIEVIMKGDEIHPRPSTHIENNLFRIVQEALTNISKHSHAKKINIRINITENKLKIKISDDGIGFDPGKMHALPENQGLGLMNMAERTESMGGHFSIKSKIGKGTEIAVEVPL